MEFNKVWNYDILLGYQTAILDLLKDVGETIEKDYPDHDKWVLSYEFPLDYIKLRNVQVDLQRKKYAVEEQMEKVLNSMSTSRLTD